MYNDGRAIPGDTLAGIDRDIRNLFGGFSRLDVYGQWKDESGKVYQEESFRYEILTHMAYEILQDYAGLLRRDLDQQSILTTCETVQVDFIS